MTKVLLIQNCITSYNLPIYNLLAAQPGLGLTVAHFGDKTKSTNQFTELVLTSRQRGPFHFANENMYTLCNNYDVVICLGDIHWLSLMMLGKKRKRSFKLVYWGIGVSASYKNKFDENKRWDFLRHFFMKSADALVFYSDYPVKKYAEKGIPLNKMFVAPNTIQVTHTLNTPTAKDSILFVGSLYKEKGITELLDAYDKALGINNELPVLNIIGGGDEYEAINTWIKEKELTHKINLLGPIYDNEKLEAYFARALACISPNQAGLSVLMSMGHGVPFITRFDAITGGERLNITHNETGILYKNEQELVHILCDIPGNGDKYIEMGKKARVFYDKFRQPENMVKGFTDAIKFVLSK